MWLPVSRTPGSQFKIPITPWKFVKIENGSREPLIEPGGVVMKETTSKISCYSLFNLFPPKKCHCRGLQKRFSSNLWEICKKATEGFKFVNPLIYVFHWTIFGRFISNAMMNPILYFCVNSLKSGKDLVLQCQSFSLWQYLWYYTGKL